MSTTPTPRTDAAWSAHSADGIISARDQRYLEACQLERELHEARWANDDLLKRLNDRVVAHIEVDRKRLATIEAHKQDAKRLAAALQNLLSLYVGVVNEREIATARQAILQHEQLNQ